MEFGSASSKRGSSRPFSLKAFVPEAFLTVFFYTSDLDSTLSALLLFMQAVHPGLDCTKNLYFGIATRRIT